MVLPGGKHGPLPRSVGIYHRLNCVNAAVHRGRRCAPRNGLSCKWEQGGRERKIGGDGLQIGREIVRLMHFRPRSSISIDLDLGHGEGGVWKV